MPNNKRKKFFFLFVDLAKAFDTVSRPKLVDLLYEKGVDKTLVNAIRALYSDTRMLVDGRSVKTELGVM